MFSGKYYTRFVFFILIFALLFSGCSSWKIISNEEYSNGEKHNDVKIILKNGEELVISEKDSVIVLADGEKIILEKQKQNRIISYKDIEAIKEDKFDFLKTCFGISWVTLVLLIALLLTHPRINLAG